MHSVFISYSSKDVEYANRLSEALTCSHIDNWYAPKSIGDGNDYLVEIPKALYDGEYNSISNDDDLETNEQRRKESIECSVLVFLLSKNSMIVSKWCPKELRYAIKKGKKIFVLQIDRTPLTDDFELALDGIQITKAYHLPPEAIKKLCEDLHKHFGDNKFEHNSSMSLQTISCKEIGIKRITGGDPYYEEGNTLSITLSNHEFYLAPPRDKLTVEQETYIDTHGMAKEDTILDTSIEEIAKVCNLSDLSDRIEASKRKIFNDFLEGNNGCYFNNKKYGINRIQPYGRTEDLAEIPNLQIELYKTDYYTHRVMKDVCKGYYADNPDFYKSIDFNHLRNHRIFFTSIAINLLLLDTKDGIVQNTLITCRSTNAAETYGRIQYSTSVIEGISFSDYDGYNRSVCLRTAVERGLLEELGVGTDLILRDSMQYYDLFVNLYNLEVGISCSVKLKPNLSLKNNVMNLHGKDEGLEVGTKKICPIDDLHSFIYNNRSEFLPQSLYTCGSYLESRGQSVLEYSYEIATLEEEFMQGKRKNPDLCGDAIYKGDHYFAIIDGDTPKGKLEWHGLPSDVFVARYLHEQIDLLPAGISGEDAISRLNDSLRECYQELSFDHSPVEERLRASVLIYSRDLQEIWSFGDCQYRINGILHDERKEVDILLSGVRSFILETELQKGVKIEDLQQHDIGRDEILPLLQRQLLLANKDVPFGYDVLDGGKINLGHIKKFSVKVGDHVVLASDGYPKLCETLKESEDILERVLRDDPLCMHENKGTKALNPENCSYDDRSYLSFMVR